MVVVATISSQEGDTLADHEIVLRGVPLAEDEAAFTRDVGNVVDESLKRAAANDVHDVNLIEESLHDDLAEFVHRRLHRRPMILTVVVEV
jgi:ribonuclease J